MRKLVVGCLVVLLTLAAVVFAGEEDFMAEMAKCGMCKHLLEQEGLLEHMHYEMHDISNGFMSVATVTPDFAEAYNVADAKMNEVGAKLMAGEEVPLCTMCQGISGLMTKGAHMENIKLEYGSVMLMTAENPELVAEIQGYVKMCNEMMGATE